ncbi:hypothetical protein [Actinomadura flavalba]|uniref:hypothetical protein n=1 Tax=Actinomadura flavalba TaxID=1120938 RepID=UPI00036FCB42|nr:hypothetical protein [Actinomadura flavalba]
MPGGGPPPGPGYGPGTPPPFFPPPGGGPPPPQRRGSSGALIAAIIGGTVVVIVALAVVVVIIASGGKTPEEQLNGAAAKLSGARGITYKGTVTSGGTDLRGDLTVTKGGRASGAVTYSGSQVTLLSADGKTFLKANSSYWRGKVSSTSEPYFLDGEQWGRLGSSDLRIDFKESLAPSVLTEKLRTAARLKREPVKTTVGGTKALRFTTGSTVLYLSDTNDPELIRYESSFPRIAADVSVAGDSAINDIRNRMGELENSFDVSSRPRISEWKRGGCTGTSGCLVEAQVAPPSGLEGTTPIEIRFNITADSLTGRDLGNCTTKITVSGSTPVWARCQVTSAAWTSWAKKGGTFYKHVQYKVAGASSSDIQSMQSGLDQE